MPHVAGQVGQHRGDVLALCHPPLDVGVGEVVPEVIGPRLLAARQSRQPGLVPDAVEHLSDRRGRDLVAGGGDEEPLAGHTELFAGYLLACSQDFDDVAAQGQTSTAASL